MQEGTKWTHSSVLVSGPFLKPNYFPRSNNGLSQKRSFLAKYCQGCNSSVFRKYLKHIYSEITAAPCFIRMQIQTDTFYIVGICLQSLKHFPESIAFLLCRYTNYKFQVGRRGEKKKPRISLTSQSSKYVTGQFKVCSENNFYSQDTSIVIAATDSFSLKQVFYGFLLQREVFLGGKIIHPLPCHLNTTIFIFILFSPNIGHVNKHFYIFEIIECMHFIVFSLATLTFSIFYTIFVIIIFKTV